MKRIAIHSGLMLALLLMLGSTLSVAQVPAPPNEPSDFSATFVGFDYSVPVSSSQNQTGNSNSQGPTPVSPDGAGFNNFGFWFQGIPGMITGDIVVDYTNKRQRFDIATTDPKNTSSIATIWKFYDKSLMYIYSPATHVCTKSSFQGTIQPFFSDLASASFEGQTGPAENYFSGFSGMLNPLTLPGNVWTYQLSTGNSLEWGTDASAHAFPLYVIRYAPGRITRLQFTFSVAGQPAASAFSLPATCAG